MANTDLTIVSQSELTESEKEIINDVPLRLDSNKCIPFTEIIKALKERSYEVSNALFTYYSEESKAFIYSGGCNSKEYYSVPFRSAYPVLLLKIRTPSNSPLIPTPNHVKKLTTGRKEYAKRNKERKIGEIIEKVNEWRMFYIGTTDKSGKFVKCSLEKAAEKVNVPKKTLDDYLLQLRAGKKYGFDFQAYKDSKVGTLRAFVKERKKKERLLQSEMGQGIDGILNIDEESRSVAQ